MYQRSDKFERTFFPRIVPKNEQTNSFLVLLSKKTKFVCSFLEESEDTKSRFEIIWPLDVFSKV